jgi:DnaJ like chaperone protein
MSIWTRITTAISALANGESLTAVFERLRTPPERSIAFTIAVIGLGAKMAKADGHVTRDEVTAFRQVFTIPKEDEGAAARVFNLARTDIAGFEDYAARIGEMFRDDGRVLCDLMEGLFHIALADGDYHPREDEFLHQVASHFGMDDAQFYRIRARFVTDAKSDPYTVLGVSRDMDMPAIKSAWRAQVRETHPDRLQARGLPDEAIKLAESRLIALNQAWEDINADRNL